MQAEASGSGESPTFSDQKVQLVGHSWYYEKYELKDSPSARDGLDSECESRYRREGARFIINVGTKIGLRYDTMATGVVFFHRFYMLRSFKTFPRYVTACCCLFLAGKVEETPKKCKDIIRVARIFLTDLQFAQFGDDPKEEVMTLERILLQTIRFDFQVEHPYSHLLKYAKCIKGDKTRLQKMVQMAWTFINDSLCTTLCLQWEPEIIAVALLHLAGKLSKFIVVDWVGKTSKQKHWWEVFVHGLTVSLLEDICHQVLDLYATPAAPNPQDSPPATPPTKSTRKSDPGKPSTSDLHHVGSPSSENLVLLGAAAEINKQTMEQLKDAFCTSQTKASETTVGMPIPRLEPGELKRKTSRSADRKEHEAPGFASYLHSKRSMSGSATFNPSKTSSMLEKLNSGSRSASEPVMYSPSKITSCSAGGTNRNSSDQLKSLSSNDSAMFSNRSSPDAMMCSPSMAGESRSTGSCGRSSLKTSSSCGDQLKPHSSNDSEKLGNKCSPDAVMYSLSVTGDLCHTGSSSSSTGHSRDQLKPHSSNNSEILSSSVSTSRSSGDSLKANAASSNMKTNSSSNVIIETVSGNKSELGSMMDSLTSVHGSLSSNEEYVSQVVPVTYDMVSAQPVVSTVTSSVTEFSAAPLDIGVNHSKYLQHPVLYDVQYFASLPQPHLQPPQQTTFPPPPLRMDHTAPPPSMLVPPPQLTRPPPMQFPDMFATQCIPPPSKYQPSNIPPPQSVPAAPPPQYPPPPHQLQGPSTVPSTHPQSSSSITRRPPPLVRAPIASTARPVCKSLTRPRMTCAPRPPCPQHSPLSQNASRPPPQQNVPCPSQNTIRPSVRNLPPPLSAAPDTSVASSLSATHYGYRRDSPVMPQLRRGRNPVPENMRPLSAAHGIRPGMIPDSRYPPARLSGREHPHELGRVGSRPYDDDEYPHFQQETEQDSHPSYSGTSDRKFSSYDRDFGPRHRPPDQYFSHSYEGNMTPRPHLQQHPPHLRSYPFENQSVSHQPSFLKLLVQNKVLSGHGSTGSFSPSGNVGNVPEEPSYEEPSYEEPSYEEPSYEEPSYEEPSYEDYSEPWLF